MESDKKRRDAVVHRIWATALSEVAAIVAIAWLLRSCMGK